jgi:two-component system, OmpR family, phosphate regulon response regulator PhoB
MIAQQTYPASVPGVGGKGHGIMKEDKQFKILVVDDEEDVTELVSYHLVAKGYQVRALNDPNLVLEEGRRFEPDIVILDVMMPGLSGVQLCRLFRADRMLKDVPVLFLTAKTEEGDRIAGLEAGADDYICKPFSPRELVLRVQGFLRRSSRGAGEPARLLSAGKIKVDVERYEVTVDGKPVEMTATEFRLLSLLVERKGRVQSREQLLANVWNYDEEMETRTVDTHIRRIREKLGDEAAIIDTVRGVGYRVVER